MFTTKEHEGLILLNGLFKASALKYYSIFWHLCKRVFVIILRCRALSCIARNAGHQTAWFATKIEYAMPLFFEKPIAAAFRAFSLFVLLFREAAVVEQIIINRNADNFFYVPANFSPVL